MNEELLNKLDSELFALNDKLEKLYEFIRDKEEYNQLSKNHQYLLTIQWDTMKTYRKVLEARIEDLKENK